MGSKPVICSLSASWRQEMLVAPTNCHSSLRMTSMSNSTGRGQYNYDVSLRWGSAFVTCTLRHSRGRSIAPKMTPRIVSESREPSEQNNYDTGTFFNPREQAVHAADDSTKEEHLWTWNLMKLLDRIADYADAQTELGGKKRRAFYQTKDWIQHRSSKRHLRHILSTFSSRLIISLIPPVAVLTSIAAVIATYNSLVDAHVLSSYFPLLHFSSLPHQLTAPALGLLLVFRTDASYSRYDETRKTWTRVFACTKDFSRQSLAWIQLPKDSSRRKDLLHYIMAFPVALKCHVLEGSDIKDDLKLLLDEDDLEVVMNSQHRPNCLIQLMTQSLSLVKISDNQKGLMDANITQFNESVSVCERIMRTPIPLSYTRLTSRALILWHLTLPIVLWDDCKWLVVFATFFSSCTLLGIEEVGVLIEEPFPMLSLDRMCAVAHRCVEDFVELQTMTDEYLKSKESKLNTAANGTLKVPSNGIPSTSLK